MIRRAPSKDIDESDLEVDGSAHAAAGLTAVGVSMKRAVEQMGVRRTAQTLLRLNQVDGFDCQGCAWPDPDPEHRHTAEFCENGAKAVTEEATLRRVGKGFFAKHSLADLAEKTDYWLGQQGRITEPMVLRDGATHYEPVSWDEAFGSGGRASPRARQPGPGGLLHLGQDLQRGGVRLPALRPRLRHQQPARLLQHVPRVDVGGAGRDDRHRQGLGEPPRRRDRRAAAGRRPEPRHQPPPDAVGAGEGEEARRQDPGDQPAARGRAGAVQEPPVATRPAGRHRPGRPPPAGARQRRPRALPGVRFTAAGVGCGRPRLRREAHPRLQSSTPTTWRSSTGPRSSGPPASTAR